jgi:hypothetical protein
MLNRLCFVVHAQATLSYGVCSLSQRYVILGLRIEINNHEVS